MVKSSIKDQSIGVKPSERFIDFIRSLDDVSVDLPENLLKFYLALTQDTNKRMIFKESIVPKTLTEEERNLLTALSDDTFQNSTDLSKVLQSLSVDSIISDGNDEDIKQNKCSTDNEIMQDGERISKNKIHQMRAEQRENQLSKLTLNLSDLKWIHQYLLNTRNDNDSVIYLHELIEGSQLILPSNEIIERNPELEARCQLLKQEQDEQKYRLMTKNVDRSRLHEPEDTISYQVKQMNKQLIAVLQFVVSVAAGFAFGFIGIELLVGNLDFGFRLLLGIICSLIIALAEIYFLAKQLSEESDKIDNLADKQAKSFSNVGSKVENIKMHND